MQYVKTIHILTKVYNEFDVITPQVEAIVAESGVKNGMVTVLTKHTTTGVTVNEALECLESDIAVALSLFAPEDRPYSHARMLRDYGSTAGNPTGHLKALVRLPSNSAKACLIWFKNFPYFGPTVRSWGLKA